MKLLVTFLVLASLAAYSSAVGKISVQGNKVLVDGKLNPIRGNSFFWSNNGWGGERFYNEGVVNWLKKDWKSNAIRAVMGVEADGGYFDDPESNKNKVITVVDAAIKADMYAVIDFQSFEAHLHQDKAVAFFQEMARRYGEYDNVIYEIYNEPKNANWTTQIKPYAIAVIEAIRAIDPDNLIIVGTPTYSQDVDIAAEDPITGYNNIAYSLHFYCGTHNKEFRRKAFVALKKNLPVFVSEWGAVPADGDELVDHEEVKKWMEFVKAHGLSFINWSIDDNEEGASIVKAGASTTGGWSEDDLSEAGRVVRQILRSYKA